MAKWSNSRFFEILQVLHFPIVGDFSHLRLDLRHWSQAVFQIHIQRNQCVTMDRGTPLMPRLRSTLSNLCDEPKGERKLSGLFSSSKPFVRRAGSSESKLEWGWEPKTELEYEVRWDIGRETGGYENSKAGRGRSLRDRFVPNSKRKWVTAWPMDEIGTEERGGESESESMTGRGWSRLWFDIFFFGAEAEGSGWAPLPFLWVSSR